MKTYIIGSMSCAEKIADVAKYLKEAHCYDVDYVKPQPDKSMDDLIMECYRHISKVDEVIVVPKPDGTIGTGTMYEMGFAKFLGKKIYTWKED